MESIKAAVLSGCLLGIGFSILKNIIPDRKLFSNLKTVMSLILLVSVITPFFKNDFSISVSAFKTESATESEVLQQALDNAYINETERVLEKSLTLYLKKSEITADKLVIETYIDEYNFLEVKKVSLFVPSNDRNNAEMIIKEQLGENVIVEFCDE